RPPVNRSCWPAYRSGGPGDADQVALGVGEVADHQARRRPLGSHPALAAEALRFGQGGLDVRYADVEDDAARIPGTAADAARNAAPVGSRDAVHETVVRRLGDRLGDGGTSVELPAEQFTEVAAELLRVLADDLEVHNRVRHEDSLPRCLACRPWFVLMTWAARGIHRAGWKSAGWNSSMRLPAGSVTRIWRPPGPETRSLRNDTP